MEFVMFYVLCQRLQMAASLNHVTFRFVMHYYKCGRKWLMDLVQFLGFA